MQEAQESPKFYSCCFKECTSAQIRDGDKCLVVQYKAVHQNLMKYDRNFVWKDGLYVHKACRTTLSKKYPAEKDSVDRPRAAAATAAAPAAASAASVASVGIAAAPAHLDRACRLRASPRSSVVAASSSVERHCRAPKSPVAPVVAVNSRAAALSAEWQEFDPVSDLTILGAALDNASDDCIRDLGLLFLFLTRAAEEPSKFRIGRIGGMEVVQIVARDQYAVVLVLSGIQVSDDLPSFVFRPPVGDARTPRGASSAAPVANVAAAAATAPAHRDSIRLNFLSLPLGDHQRVVKFIDYLSQPPNVQMRILSLPGGSDLEFTIDSTRDEFTDSNFTDHPVTQLLKEQRFIALRAFGSCAALLYSMSISYPRTVAMQVRASSVEFRDGIKEHTWKKKMLRIFSILSSMLINRNPEWNAFACMFACILETWPISWTESGMLEQIGLSVTSATMVEFLHSHAVAYRALKDHLASPDNLYYPQMLLYDNVDFSRRDELEHGTTKASARVPVPIDLDSADFTPRLKPEEIKPELFIWNRDNDSNLDNLRVHAFHQALLALNEPTTGAATSILTALTLRVRELRAQIHDDPFESHYNPDFSYSLMGYDADLNCGTKRDTIKMLDQAIYFEQPSLAKQPILMVSADGGALNVLSSCIELRCTDVRSFNNMELRMGGLHYSMFLVELVIDMYSESILKRLAGLAGLPGGLLKKDQKPDYRPHLEFIKIVRTGLSISACEAFEQLHPEKAQTYDFSDVCAWLQDTIDASLGGEQFKVYGEFVLYLPFVLELHALAVLHNRSDLLMLSFKFVSNFLAPHSTNHTYQRLMFNELFLHVAQLPLEFCDILESHISMPSHRGPGHNIALDHVVETIVREVKDFEKVHHGDSHVSNVVHSSLGHFMYEQQLFKSWIPTDDPGGHHRLQLDIALAVACNVNTQVNPFALDPTFKLSPATTAKGDLSRFAFSPPFRQVSLQTAPLASTAGSGTSSCSTDAGADLVQTAFQGASEASHQTVFSHSQHSTASRTPSRRGSSGAIDTTNTSCVGSKRSSSQSDLLVGVKEPSPRRLAVSPTAASMNHSPTCVDVHAPPLQSTVRLTHKQENDRANFAKFKVRDHFAAEIRKESNRRSCRAVMAKSAEAGRKLDKEKLEALALSKNALVSGAAADIGNSDETSGSGLIQRLPILDQDLIMPADHKIVHSLTQHFPDVRALLAEQYNAINHFIDLRHDILVLYRTSIGKSLIYQVAADVLHQKNLQLHRPVAIKVIVLTPLISIAGDQINRLRAAGIGCIDLASAFQPQHNDKPIVISSPEDFARIVAKLATGSDKTSLLRVCAVVVDEAHTVAAWKDDFRPDFGNVGATRTKYLRHAPIIALTGSATADVAAIICESLGLGAGKFPLKTLNSSFDRPELKFSTRTMRDFETDIVAPIEALLSQPLENSGVMIIYVHDPQHTVTLMQRLVQRWSSDVAKSSLYLPRIRLFHAQLSDEDRASNYESLKIGVTRVAIATICLGMGIEIPRLSTVISFCGVNHVNEFVQQGGRGGRDGSPSLAQVVYLNSQLHVHHDRFSESSQLQEREIHQMSLLISRPSCIRKQLQICFSTPELEYAEPTFAYLPLRGDETDAAYRVHARYLARPTEHRVPLPTRAAGAASQLRMPMNLDSLPSCFGNSSTSPSPWCTPAEWQCVHDVPVDDGSNNQQRANFVVRHGTSTYRFKAFKSTTGPDSSWMPEQFMTLETPNGAPQNVPSYPSLDAEFPGLWSVMTQRLAYPVKVAVAAAAAHASTDNVAPVRVKPDLRFGRVSISAASGELSVFCLTPVSLLPCTYKWDCNPITHLNTFRATVEGACAAEFSQMVTRIQRLPNVRRLSNTTRAKRDIRISVRSSEEISISAVALSSAAAAAAGASAVSAPAAATTTGVMPAELDAFPFVVLPVANGHHPNPGAAHPMDRDPLCSGCCDNCDLDPVFIRGVYVLPLMITILKVVALHPPSQGMYIKALVKAVHQRFPLDFVDVDTSLRQHVHRASFTGESALTLFAIRTVVRYMEAIGLLRLQANFANCTSESTMSAWVAHAIAPADDRGDDVGAWDDQQGAAAEVAPGKQLRYAPNMVFAAPATSAANAPATRLRLLETMYASCEIRTRLLVICPRYLVSALCRVKSKSPLGTCAGAGAADHDIDGGDEPDGDGDGDGDFGHRQPDELLNAGLAGMNIGSREATSTSDAAMIDSVNRDAADDDEMQVDSVSTVSDASTVRVRGRLSFHVHPPQPSVVIADTITNTLGSPASTAVRPRPASGSRR